MHAVATTTCPERGSEDLSRSGDGIDLASRETAVFEAFCVA